MSLRKLTLVALALAFLLMSAALYAQQVPHFVLSGTTFQVRQHGQTEVVGDITLTCDVAGTFPGTTTNPSALTVVYAPVFGIVNSIGGIFSSANAKAFNARFAHVESEPGTTAIFLQTASLNTVTTNSLTVLVSGSAAVGDIIRVMGIRVNIGEANLPAATQVNATVIAIPPNAFQIDNVNTFPVAFVLDEIKVSVSPSNPMLICQPSSCKTGTITVSEKFPSALTTVTDENDFQHLPHSASPPANANANGKLASNGTQLLITIGNILPGVTVIVPTSVTNGTGTLTETLLGVSSFTNSSATAVASASFTYFTAADSLVTNESISFSISFCPSGIPVPPVFGTITAQVLLGPNAGTGFNGEVSSSKILSFVKNPLNTPPDAISSLLACTTNLLCKFLTTATGAVPGGGYDTGIAIANSSKDIWFPSNSGSALLGALPQQGVCRVFLFGSGGTIAANPSTTPTFTTSVVLPGQDAVFSLFATAGVGAGFQGYSIIQCDFQFAHAEAIVADKQFSTFSHGYDCLVIPDPAVTGGRIAVPVGFNGGNTQSGESFGQKSGR